MKKTTYPFEWLEEDGLMVVHVEINAENILPCQRNLCFNFEQNTITFS
jgi:hypothetical protein